MKQFFILLFIIVSAGVCNAQTDTLKTASGLQYIYLKKGGGQKITKGDKVKVHYTGQLPDGYEFDSSEGKKPISFLAGTGRVIKGWDEMLLLLKAGDEIRVIIPAELAYGSRGIPDPAFHSGYRIPPDSPLIFKMQVVEVGK